MLYEICVRFLCRKGLAACLAHGCEDLVPGKSVLVAEKLCLVAQILAELGHILAHSLKHSVKRFFLHS